MPKTKPMELQDILDSMKIKVSIYLHRLHGEAPWSKTGRNNPHYRLIMITPTGRGSFDYWGSNVDHDKLSKDWGGSADLAKKAKALVRIEEVLCILQWRSPGSFSEFCREYGYENTPEAMETWADSARQHVKLTELVPDEKGRALIADYTHNHEQQD